MATKDWEKNKDGRYINENKNMTIDIGRGYNPDTQNFEKNRIVLNIVKNNKTIKNKQFKTRSQALTFAKDYMRKH